MKRKARKLLVGIIALSMVLTSITWTGPEKKAEAAVSYESIENEHNATNILSESGDVLVSSSSSHTGTSYNGYILSNTSTALTAKYLKITYTIDDVSGVKTSSKLFNFQPYTSGFEGWQDNYITFADAVPNEDGSYSSYISVRSIKESMKLDQTCFGINLNFCSAQPKITLTGYYAMNVKATKTAIDLYDTNADAALDKNRDIITITGTQLEAAGIDLSGLMSSSVTITPYIQVTKAHSRSYIAFSVLNTDASSNSSNKALIGTEWDIPAGKKDDNGATNSQYIIHCGFGTDKVGTGAGEAGTGIYNKTASINTSKWNGKEKANISLRLQVRTKDTECKLLGVVFGNKEAFTVNEDGGITKGFETSGIKVESDKLDTTDVREKSEAELKAEADEELWQQLRNIKAQAITAEDCLSEELYDDLQEEVTKAQAVMDNEEATADDLLAALESLNKVLKEATNEPPLGLKKAIDYCKSLKEEDYSSESFAKLAPAIAAAEEVFANKATKTDAQLKTARDTLEAVRVALVPKLSTAESDPKDFRILSKKEIVKEMGAGINLGNTMDGGLINAKETSWQAYKTTKAYIKALHDAGYNTVRIPVTWNGYIKNDYSIDEAWISRVQEIVDYCVEQDMYAIINIHHDGAANHDNRGDNPECWLDTYKWNIEKVYQKYAGVWKTIAERFKDYDEHLIFESMNEVTDAHTGSTNEDDAVLNALNQLFINTVRATGSNNTKRWLAITGRFATTTAIKTMPEDTLADMGDVNTTRLMFSVHIYKDNSNTRWTYNQIKSWQGSLSDSIKAVQALDTNMPLYVGEYGVRTQPQSGSETGYNNAERALYYETCAAVCDFYGAIPIVWDQGAGNYAKVKTEKGLFTDWDRPNLKPSYDDVVHGTIRGTYETGKDSDLGKSMTNIYTSYGHSSINDNGVSKDPVITPATELTVSETSLILKAGERVTVTAETDSSRDVVLWTTQNDSIATVSRGLIHAKNGGMTTVRARTQTGSVEKEIKVIVVPDGSATATEIQTDKACYEITEGKTTTIQATLTPAESKDKITYTSSNTEIATVDEKGKVTGVKPGKTYIIVSATSGVSSIVSVHVSAKNSSSSTSKSNEASELESVTENKFVLEKTGDTQILEISVTPVDTDSEMTFYSTNSSVAAVDSVKVTVDADGKVKVPVTAVSNGTAIIVGITENGLKVLYAVGVGDMEVSDLEEPTDPTPEGIEGSGEGTGGEGTGGEGTGGEGTGGEGTGGEGTGGEGTGGEGTGGEGTGGEGTGGEGTGGEGTGGEGTGGEGTGGEGTGGTGGTQTEQKESLTLKQNKVIIAAGKSVTVSFTASSVPKVTTSSSKVATAKVNKNTVVITVPKKAEKGASAKIQVTVGKKAAVINVTVQNPAKKIKAAKKTVTVKKKKTVTAKFKVTATNKKKAAADTIKATSQNKKVAKIVSCKVKKGKADVKIRGVKKGKTKVTLKIGKKSAKVTVVVK